MKRTWLILLAMALSLQGLPQSIEFMPGTKRIFMDVQYLASFKIDSKMSLFSRTRATSDYGDNQTDLFTGGYLNYTIISGFGGTFIGRISSQGAGLDIGLHFFKAKKKFMIYALPSININRELLFSWFSIIRFTPELRNNWKIYTSMELFSAFAKKDHLSSVQRIRTGLDKNGYQFGLAANSVVHGGEWKSMDINAGIFLRKQF